MDAGLRFIEATEPLKLNSDLNKLPLPDQCYLDVAEGWIGLGDYLAANEELEQITPELKTHPFALELSCKIYAKAKRWDMAVEIVRSIAKSLPDNP